MVKNDAGGNKGKGLARKHVNAAKCGGSKLLRMATDEAEQYAVVSKMLGNGMCYVRLLSGGSGGSGSDKLCIIRNKFKGRGKRDNILDSGSWVLVGMREWSSKQDTCDLLEVYNDGERDRLLKNEPCFKGVAAAANASDGDGVKGGGSSVQFADSTTMMYSKLIKGDKDDADDEDDDLQQQRVYDMPSSEDESDASDASDELVEEVQVPVHKQQQQQQQQKKVQMDHINVDDI
jgi:hypothetical protein